MGACKKLLGGLLLLGVGAAIGAILVIAYEKYEKDNSGGDSGGLTIASVKISQKPVFSYEDSENFVCGTLDWWPPLKNDYGTYGWGNASVPLIDFSEERLQQLWRGLSGNAKKSNGGKG